MPTYIKEESKKPSRLQRDRLTNFPVDYIELTTDEKAERLDVKLHHEGAVPSLITRLNHCIDQQLVPVSFIYTSQGSWLRFFSSNSQALTMLLNIDAISAGTFSTAHICMALDKSDPVPRYLR